MRQSNPTALNLTTASIGRLIGTALMSAGIIASCAVAKADLVLPKYKSYLTSQGVDAVAKPKAVPAVYQLNGHEITKVEAIVALAKDSDSKVYKCQPQELNAKAQLSARKVR